MGLLWNPATPTNVALVPHAQDAARASGLRLQSLKVRDPVEIDSAFATMTRERLGALIVLADPMLVAERSRIADLASKIRLPAMYMLTDHVKAGGLMAYSRRC